MARDRRWRFLRSSLAGLAATAVDLAALFVLIEGCQLAPTTANAPALLAGACLQFLGNKYFAFFDRSPVCTRQVLRFTLVEIGSLALNALAFHLLVTTTTVPYALARPLGSLAVYVGFSYPLWTRVFARSSGSAFELETPARP